MFLILLATTHLGISHSIMLTTFIFWIPVQEIRYALYMPSLPSNPMLLSMARKFWLALCHVLHNAICFSYSPTSLWVWLAHLLLAVVSFLPRTFLLPFCHVHAAFFPFFFLLEVLCLACTTPGWISATVFMLSTAGRDTGFAGLCYGHILQALMLWAFLAGLLRILGVSDVHIYALLMFPLSLFHG